MHRTEGADNVNNQFTDGPPGTTVSAAWLNAVQEEIAAVIEAQSIALSREVDDQKNQLNQAIDNKISAAIVNAESSPVRQTVLEGAVDSDGYADFLKENIADQIELEASATNCKLTLAYGNIDYLVNITADTTPANWQGLTGVGIFFLYAEYNPTFETISYNKTRVRPQYGQKFDITKNVLMHFDGDNASTTMTDEYGNVWTAMGNAQLSTGDKKFGSASLELDGTGDYIKNETITSLGDKFCIEFDWHTDNTGTINQGLIGAWYSSPNFYGLQVIYNHGASGKLTFYLSTDGASWNIANGAVGTNAAWSADQWYHLRIEWDGATFKTYLDGDLDYSVAMTNPICAITAINIGALSNHVLGYLDGGIDELRMDIGYTRDEEAFTPATSAYSPDAIWFDINTMKMYEGAPGAWTEKIRLFLGEAIMAGNHVTSVVTYALKGYYDSGAFAVATSTLYTKNHNIGCDKITEELFYRGQAGWLWVIMHALETSGSAMYGSVFSVGYKNTKIKTFANYTSPVYASQVGGSTGAEAGEYKVIARRSF